MILRILNLSRWQKIPNKGRLSDPQNSTGRTQPIKLLSYKHDTFHVNRMTQRVKSKAQRGQQRAKRIISRNILMKESRIFSQVDFRIARDPSPTPAFNWSVYNGYPFPGPLLNAGFVGIKYQ